jgi:hypothetical protein
VPSHLPDRTFGDTATNATTGTNATNAATATTAANALSLRGVAASAYTHSDCASQTGQIKGFAMIAAPGAFSSTFNTITAYSCSAQTVQAKRLGSGDYEVQFVGNPATIAIGNAENPGAPSFSYVSVTTLAPGDRDHRRADRPAAGTRPRGRAAPRGLRARDAGRLTAARSGQRERR